MNICAQLRDYSGFLALPPEKTPEHVLLDSKKRLAGHRGLRYQPAEAHVCRRQFCLYRPALQTDKEIILPLPLLLSRDKFSRSLKFIGPKNAGHSSGCHDMCRGRRLRRMQAFYLKWLARTATSDKKQDHCNNSQDYSRFHNISFQKHLAFSP